VPGLQLPKPKASHNAVFMATELRCLYVMCLVFNNLTIAWGLQNLVVRNGKLQKGTQAFASPIWIWIYQTTQRQLL